VNNVVCLTATLLVVAGLQMSGNLGEATGSLYGLVYLLLWQLFGSVALGYLVGLLLSVWSTRVSEHGETLILLIGCILLCIGLALLLNLSTLVVSLALGATTANLSPIRGRLAQVQARTDPPFYALFFVLAGAHLNVGLLKSLGVIGLAYILVRAGSKLIGARIAAYGTPLPPPIRSRLGVAMLTHAGLAIGLVLSLADRFPAVGEPLATIVLAAILVCEVVGPICIRAMVLRSGESRARELTGLELMG
jgi:Kef-type K+ transport system membrane component KefB